jgi:acetylornithine deacetylase/succinyl-diaminopimelate desuccinylase-like protein
MKSRLVKLLVSVLICVAVAFPTIAQKPVGVRAYRIANEASILNDFVEFLSIPNVASDTTNIRRNAATLIEMMKRRGISARLLEGAGSPAVFGELSTPGAKTTVGIYAHYDGQPVDVSKWATDPFKPVLRNKPMEDGGSAISFPKAGARIDPESRIYARSASDDKAPIIAMLVALDALRTAGDRPTVNLKFLFDGEEEAGSPHLEDIVATNSSLLGADVWICADGPVHQTRRPLIYFGVRGVVTVDVTVYGADRGLHSGHYGNWAPNPAMRLAKLLASMKDDSGRVLVDGFYDDVEPLGADEVKALAEMPAIDADLMREYALTGADGAGKTLAQLINEPSLNIDGLRSEYVGREARTIIPSEATATLDLRLVKGIDPRRQVTRVVEHIRKQGYFVVDRPPDRDTRLKHSMIALVTSAGGYRAVRTPMNLPISKRIIHAVERALDARPVLAPTLGGSVPLYILEKATGAPQVGLPIVNHDNNQHSANENLRIQNLWDGIEIFAKIMTLEN